MFDWLARCQTSFSHNQNPLSRQVRLNISDENHLWATWILRHRPASLYDFIFEKLEADNLNFNLAENKTGEKYDEFAI